MSIPRIVLTSLVVLSTAVCVFFAARTLRMRVEQQSEMVNGKRVDKVDYYQAQVAEAQSQTDRWRRGNVESWADFYQPESDLRDLAVPDESKLQERIDKYGLRRMNLALIAARADEGRVWRECKHGQMIENAAAAAAAPAAAPPAAPAAGAPPAGAPPAGAPPAAAPPAAAAPAASAPKSYTVTVTVPDAQPLSVTIAPPAAENAEPPDPAAPPPPPAAAGAVTTFLQPNTVVFVFESFPADRARSATVEGTTGFLGEFVVMRANGQALELQLPANATEHDIARLKAAGARADTWVLYETLPRDDHALYTDLAADTNRRGELKTLFPDFWSYPKDQYPALFPGDLVGMKYTSPAGGEEVFQASDYFALQGQEWPAKLADGSDFTSDKIVPEALRGLFNREIVPNAEVADEKSRGLFDLVAGQDNSESFEVTVKDANGADVQVVMFQSRFQTGQLDESGKFEPDDPKRAADTPPTIYQGPLIVDRHYVVGTFVKNAEGKGNFGLAEGKFVGGKFVPGRFFSRPLYDYATLFRVLHRRIADLLFANKSLKVQLDSLNGTHSLATTLVDPAAAAGPANLKAREAAKMQELATLQKELAELEDFRQKEKMALDVVQAEIDRLWAENRQLAEQIAAKAASAVPADVATPRVTQASSGRVQ